ncbi:MAG: GAF domain-containing sensor histidine kinase [Anaerolineae bacterium]|nr:GAF domain-containing sensor histidine kinase [Anaerolineae bacterium]MDQ7034416.1 GAF domain-containing sensor histidine kinase [Anaerolineae bacterium]
MEQKNLLEQYKRIIEINQELGTTYDHVSLLRKIVFAAKELLDTEVASILLLDNATGKLHFAMSTNIKPHEMEEITIPLEGSIAGWIFTHGEPRVIANAANDPNWNKGVDKEIDFVTRNILGVPMRTHKDVIGVVQAINKKHNRDFTDNDIVTLRTLASQAAMAIENARLFQQSDFIAELVHELRTPLAALKTSTTLLKRSDLPETKRGDIVETMRGETERLINLTNEFLDVARHESGRISLNAQSFAIKKLLTEAVDIVAQQAADKGVIINIAEEDYTVIVDRDKIKQVLLNLLTNAIKYNRENGTINLLLEVIEGEEQTMLQITVQDSGFGIAREHQKNMFQKFYRVPTLENVARGTGLGLVLCKNIIEAHGGRIWLESEVNVGSKFFITVPLAD